MGLVGLLDGSDELLNSLLLLLTLLGIALAIEFSKLVIWLLLGFVTGGSVSRVEWGLLLVRDFER